MRPKTSNRDLPPRMIRIKRKLKSGKDWESFYYNGRDAEGRRVQIPLGHDLNEAKRKWADLECIAAPAETGLMRFIFDRYERDVIPQKGPRTQRDNLAELKFLRKVFDSAPIDAITPQMIAQYRDSRKSQKKGEENKPALVRANREITTLSHVFNMAREWGYTAKENPVTGVRKNKETPRDYYAENDVWDAVYGIAREELKDAMDLAYLTGQRPADVLRMRLSDIKDGALDVKPNKTTHSSGKRLRILLDAPEGGRTQLGLLVDRVRARKIASLALVATPAGVRVTQYMLRGRFEKARAAAAKAADEAGNADLAQRIRDFQFMDIRPKAASETDLSHASKLLGHTDKRITETVYRRVGEKVMPTK